MTGKSDVWYVMKVLIVLQIFKLGCQGQEEQSVSLNDSVIPKDEIRLPSEKSTQQPDLVKDSLLFSSKVRKSDQKCSEYSKIVTETVNAIPLIPTVEPISISVPKCAHNSITLTGNTVEAGEFPFMAIIGVPDDSDNRPTWICGGALISDRWVLTAAHCTFSRQWVEQPKWIRLGVLDLLSTDNQSVHQDYDIDTIIVHPQYRYPIRYNDIALISTTIPVQFTKFIRPACLNTKSHIPEEIAIATKWENTDFFEASSRPLSREYLKIFDNQQCTKVYKENNRQLPLGITNTMLCVGGLKHHDDCQGTTGGPLVIRERENMCKIYVIGILSFGKTCGRVESLDVYTRVSEYIDWIEKVIW